MNLATLPEPGPARDTALLGAVRRGNYRARWATVTSTIPGHTAKFRIMADALMVQGVRINVSANLEQQIADLLGCSLLTPRLADLAFLQRTTTLLPQIADVTASTAGMIARSAMVDEALAATSTPRSLIQTVGKHWVISNSLDFYAPGTKGENYGWHFPGATLGGSTFEPAVSGNGLRVVQGQGWVHPPEHTDASQTCVLVDRKCVVDGVTRDLWDVLKDPAIAPLASHEGAVSVLRQPGCPVLGSLGWLTKAWWHAGSLTGSVIGGSLGGVVGATLGGALGAGLDLWRQK